MSLWKKKKPQKKKTAKKPKPKPKPYVSPEIPKASWSKPILDSNVMLVDKCVTVVKPKPDPEKEFLKTFRELTQRHRAWDIWNDFVVMAACALSNPVDKARYDEREKRYLTIINRYDKHEQRLFPELFAHVVMALELNPEQDFLGKLYMMLDLGDKGRQQIFTPYSVCELMAEMTMSNVVAKVQQKGYITIDDPCCGGGATLIASIHAAKRRLEKAGLNYQNHILVSGQDVDETVALMCYIQLSLLGVAAYIKIGNTITEPMSSKDSLENYWFTPMCFSNVWAMRRIFLQMDKMIQQND